MLKLWITKQFVVDTLQKKCLKFVLKQVKKGL
jgi:hypothetical protein